MAKAEDLDKTVALPPGLTPTAILKAIEYVEKTLADLVEIYYEQANVFSGIVGIYGTTALHEVSTYEKNRNLDTAQQRFPDLKRRGSGDNPEPIHCLESKGSKRVWDIQSHYDHPGWYIVWRYLVDRTMSLHEGRPVIIWRVDVVYLERSDWKYEKSSAGDAGGGRTHTFGVRHPASKLKGCAVYARKDVITKHGKPVPKNGNGDD
jgi:hypothetical protein